MDPNETMVENEIDDTAADDALQEGIAEETDESEQSLESLNEDEGEPAEEEPKQGTQGTSEPGWIKKRVEKAVNKAVAEALARQQAQFDAQMAPIREKMLTDEAKELVRQGEFKSLDRAKEYLQLKNGIAPGTPEPKQQPRNSNGQFAPKDDPVTSARIDMLAHQADAIKAKTGVDVMAEFNSNEEIKQKIIAGEMDFYDVADYLKEKPSRKKPPSPMRSPNGAIGANQPNAIDSMSDEQFDRMERKIKEGARYTLR
jgi:hypothetical protein